MENFTCAKPVRGSGATREPTGQIWIYDYAVPVCKKGRPNCGGPSEEGKRPAGDDGRSHSKASKPLRCCDTRHCGRHGTCSSCNASSSSGDGFDINRRTIANMLIANSSYPHVVHNKAASFRHAYFAAQFLVHVPQLCRRLIALAYEWNVRLRVSAFASRQTGTLSDIGY